MLRPASFTQGPALQSALQHLEAALKGKAYLVGEAMTLADVSSPFALHCMDVGIPGSYAQRAGTAEAGMVA